MVAKQTLSSTAKLRWTLGFLVLITSIFIITAMGNSGGWAIGQITTVWSLAPTTSTTCPDKVAAGSTCEVVSTVTEVVSSDLDYGLFGKVKYVTKTDTVTSWTLAVNGGSPEKQSPLTSHGQKEVSEMENYSVWAKGNAPYINNVRGTQCFALWSFFSTTVAWVVLVAALHLSPSKAVTESRIKAGFYWLCLSFFSLFLAFVIWVGVPLSAFTNACEPSTGLAGQDYVCVQLNGGLCPPATIAAGGCAVHDEVTKAGGMWGLLFFSFLLQFFAMVCWRKLFAEVARSPYDDDSAPAASGAGDPTATPYNTL